MSVTAVNNSSAAASASSAPTNQLAATENRFLTLLVAQMKNQDPLNPLDNAQVTSQMAQLSTVQGVNQINTQLTQLLSQLQGMQASSLAGHSVLVPGNSLTLAAGAAGAASSAQGGVQLGAAATSVKIQIKDGAGAVVRTIDLGAHDAGIAAFTWDGLNDAGKAMAAGKYSFDVVAAADGAAVDATALTAAKVQGVIPSASGMRLDLGAGGTVDYGSVLEVL